MAISIAVPSLIKYFKKYLYKMDHFEERAEDDIGVLIPSSSFKRAGRLLLTPFSLYYEQV